MNVHADARSVLLSWRAPDGEQRRLRREYLDHLDRHPAATRRECRAGHLTASVAVLDPTANHTVLTLHRGSRAWIQLGGHCEDGDTTLADVALREATEESGIHGLRLLPGPLRLERHVVACGGGSRHLDVQYAAVSPENARLTRAEEESDGLAWFPLTALPDTADGPCRRLVTAAAAAVRSAHAIPD